MDLPSYFNDMLSEIRPSQELLEECVRAHSELREFLLSDPDLKDIIVTTFLQGSYRRSTLIRPAEGSKPDVDVVVVTNLDPNSRTPAEVQNIFCRVLDKHPDYRGNYQRQGRSIGLSHGPVNLDLVITAAPSEVFKGILKSESFGVALTVEADPAWMLRRDQASGRQDWKSEPLLIPDRDANRWEETDPISQIEWTHDKNQRTNGHYVNVVKAIKWWWAQNSSGEKGTPKGYLIERLVGLHCPDGIETVARGVTDTLEGIRDTYAVDVQFGRTPFIPDVGIPTNDVFKRIKPASFRAFHESAIACAHQARAALDDPDSGTSAEKWAEIFGSVFPTAPGGGRSSTGKSSDSEGFSRPTRPAVPRKGTFA